MFCPKCGNEIAEGAAFCGKCGAEIGGKKKITNVSSGEKDSSTLRGTNSGKKADANSAASIAGFTPLALAGRVAGVVAAICMFMPWLSIPELNTLYNYVSQFGVDSSSNGDFTILNLGFPFEVMSRSIQSIGVFKPIIMVLWIVAVVALIGGLVFSAIKRDSNTERMLLIGCLVAALVGTIWFIFIITYVGLTHNNYIVVGWGCIASIVFSLVAAALVKFDQNSA